MKKGSLYPRSVKLRRAIAELLILNGKKFEKEKLSARNIDYSDERTTDLRSLLEISYADFRGKMDAKCKDDPVNAYCNAYNNKYISGGQICSQERNFLNEIEAKHEKGNS